jgi:hypothetical protein
MSVGWVAGSTRARLLLGRRLGAGPALALARSSSMAEALATLAAGPYGRHGDVGADLAAAQRAIAATTLLNLRLLAGWLPPSAVGLVRALAGWFELANIEDRLAYLLGHEPGHPFELGSLTLAWSTVGRAQTTGDLRAALAASAWGDPGGEEPDAVHASLRVAWARRVLAEVPEAQAWVGGALAVLVARMLSSRGAGVGSSTALTSILGTRFDRAVTVGALAQSLPAAAAWALEGIAEPEDLWRAETAWWTRVERDAEAMVSGHREGRHAVIGVVALLAADARRAAAALEAAARGSGDVFEEIVGAAG